MPLLNLIAELQQPEPLPVEPYSYRDWKRTMQFILHGQNSQVYGSLTKYDNYKDEITQHGGHASKIDRPGQH